MSRVLRATALASLGMFMFFAQRPEAAATAKANGKFKVAVVDRAVVGGYAENLTYVSGGRFAGFAAMAVGARAIGWPIDHGNAGRQRTLFDFDAAGPRFRPTGFVYASDWDRFVANDSNGMANLWPELMYVFDSKGRVEKWPVVRADGIATTQYSEGLAYVPLAATGWPADLRGTFLMVGFTDQTGTFPRVDVMEASNGVFTVTRQIPLPPAMALSWGSLAVLSSGELLLSAYGECNLYRADAAAFADLSPGEPMALTQEPIAASSCPSTGWQGGEGIVMLPDGRLASSVEPAQLAIFPAADPGGTWTASETHQLRFGLGLFTPSGIAWDDTRDRFLVKDVRTPADSRGNAVFSVTASLTASSLERILSEEIPVQSRNFSGLTYRADNDAAVVGRLGRALVDFPIGYPPVWAETRTPAILAASLADPIASPDIVDLTDTLGLLSGWALPLYNPGNWNNGPAGLSFIATEGRYAALFRGDSLNIRVLNSAGTLERTVPVSVSCADPNMTFGGNGQVAAVAESPLGARYLVIGTCRLPVVTGPQDLSLPQVVLLDENGAEIFKFDISEFDRTSAPSYVTAITSGKHAGDFALLDSHAQMVVFRVTRATAP